MQTNVTNLFCRLITRVSMLAVVAAQAQTPQFSGCRSA
jgi:hypothetical protein